MQHACNYHPQRFPTGQLSASSQSPDEASNHLTGKRLDPPRELSVRSVLFRSVPKSNRLVDEKKGLHREYRPQLNLGKWKQTDRAMLSISRPCAVFCQLEVQRLKPFGPLSVVSLHSQPDVLRS